MYKKIQLQARRALYGLFLKYESGNYTHLNSLAQVFQTVIHWGYSLQFCSPSGLSISLAWMAVLKPCLLRRWAIDQPGHATNAENLNPVAIRVFDERQSLHSSCNISEACKSPLLFNLHLHRSHV